MICKPRVTRKGVVLREVPVPVSPSAKKRKAEDVAKHISKKQKKKLRKLVINDESIEEDAIQDPPPQGTPIVVSSLFVTSTISTSTNLPPFVTTSLDTNSPTFDNILNQPITSLFCSQSTEPLVTHEEAHTSSDDDKNVFGATFGDIQFDTEKEDILDNIILTGKQFKILNWKLNYLLKIQADGGGKHSVSNLEVDLMLKQQVGRLCDAIYDVYRNNEKRVKNQLSTFSLDLRELKDVANECHILFIQDLKKVREDVNLKIQELRDDMSKL
ncbi:unnamed protein product [Lactuca saligna]|uniref:Uncharacterized protein n=1 Tax=Lactuca saligna TaxID=75948 RepID=A0AA35ZDM6_LACSI|nr:unnamed protein product [Lactuca saligna]